MSVKDIAKLGTMLAQFLAIFGDCFAREAGRRLLRIYVQGLLSGVQRKNVEAIALDQSAPPRTLQRFLESIAWDEQKLRDRCQRLVAKEHADPEAIGCVDETGVPKSGRCTAGVKRQYNGNRGKVENCVNHVAIAYSASAFACLLDIQLYLPRDWTEDPERRRKNYIPDEVVFKTKPQIALELIDRAKRNGVRVAAWTADELYGRDGRFLDGLDQRSEAFVVEIPPNARVWLAKPKTLKNKARKRTGRPCKHPRFRQRERTPKMVRNLVRHSKAFHGRKPQRYRIKNTHHGEEVWEVRWRTCWRKTHDDTRVSNRCTLIVARNVLTGEVKYFLSNRTPKHAGWSVRKLLRVAFGRWPIEDCFREDKEELGLDHYECRGWRCIHRHLYATLLAGLFCARARQRLSRDDDVEHGVRLTLEQVRRAADVYVASLDLPPRIRARRYQEEADRQRYYAQRNAQAARSHRKTRRARLRELGIAPDKIKSACPGPSTC